MLQTILFHLAGGFQLSHRPQKNHFLIFPKSFGGKLGFAQDVWKKTNIFCQMVVLMLMHSGTKQKITFNKSMQQLQKRLKKKQNKNTLGTCAVNRASPLLEVVHHKSRQKKLGDIFFRVTFFRALSDLFSG